MSKRQPETRDLRTFLVTLYESLSRAEVEAMLYGKQRMRQLVRSGHSDVAVPVYHAADLEMELDTGITLQQTKQGYQVHLEQSSSDGSSISFSFDVLDILTDGDIEVDGKGDDFPRRKAAIESTHQQIDSLIQRRAGMSDSSKGGNSILDQPIDTIDDLEAETIENLKGTGVTTLGDLLWADTNRLNRAIDDEEKLPEINELKDSIREMRTLGRADSDSPAAPPIETINGLSRQQANLLRDNGFQTVVDLASVNEETIADIFASEGHTVARRQIMRWIETANRRLSHHKQQEGE
ncbi:hypothetical protein K0C01_07935 [Salinarchaeum sp. IM2453]|uniref:hypothetical protein n=1 Tax=Salinarchaeum sp. IM2453 TaxID=2862870 RepID=UPI001C828251|nr:hypothetical protein [Salinarchaeum sp. IM2453]QZA87737.1 hypothetical protein K0C01_07935 [Salinarchaeum sp. IM2453]